ncbi:General transcription factor II-I repeat domain-containing protein 2A [Trachymyrmex cornetzi]|uniref:General transcription factor II-I repeat domain-containing protein 2A n=1 Tax=Trachymyrmex cornetzi TaxID=471704 RepID=A0A151J2M4_9HYME|nr:General transcription factor II-I repeat domain-containing protein 2A [Trachymyrmex cornetzi]
MERNFFASINNKTTCLLCGHQPSTVTKYNLHRHYNIKHSKDYSKYMDKEKFDLIEELKLVYKDGCNSSSHVDNAIPSVKALTVLYAISNLIAKNSKPFCEGEFVKECIIAAVESFGNSLTFEEATSIPLSDKTVKSRIDDIASSLQNKLKSLLASCSFFSLCLDESTDNRHVSQLSIFARIVQNNFLHVEELLNFVPLHNTTTGIDIFEAVNQTLQKFDIDFSKCSAIVTHGAKAMTGSKNGFFGQLKQRGLKFPVIHCIIHQEVLCGKVVKLCTAMQMVTNIINMIKGDHKFLSHRKFQHFIEERNALYKDVPLYCEVRWLSAGKYLEKFFAIRKEIFLFLQDHFPTKCDEFQFFFEDLDSLCELALIIDVTNHLNILNSKLQKIDQTISQLVSHIDSFRRKLVLFKRQLENNIIHFFPSCQILFEEHGTNCDFRKQLNIIESLIDQFDTRFSDFETLRQDLTLFENPLTVQIEEQSLEFQADLCDLQCDLSLKTRLKMGVEFFKILDVSCYPRLRKFSLRIFSMFGSTYLCECSFSKMKVTKTEKRSSLNDTSLSSIMRTTPSKISVDIPFLVELCKRPRRSN